MHPFGELIFSTLFNTICINEVLPTWSFLPPVWLVCSFSTSTSPWCHVAHSILVWFDLVCSGHPLLRPSKYLSSGCIDEGTKALEQMRNKLKWAFNLSVCVWCGIASYRLTVICKHPWWWWLLCMWCLAVFWFNFVKWMMLMINVCCVHKRFVLDQLLWLLTSKFFCLVDHK